MDEGATRFEIVRDSALRMRNDRIFRCSRVLNVAPFTEVKITEKAMSMALQVVLLCEELSIRHHFSPVTPSPRNYSGGEQ